MARELLKEMPNLTSNWPVGNAYLIDQLKRAMSSILLNIAEGNGKRSQRERKRFFAIARGSTAEVAAIMDIAFDLSFINKESYERYSDTLLQVIKILYKL